MRVISVLMLMLIVAGSAVIAASPFEPVPAARKKAYAFKFKKNFYADEAAWREDVSRARSMTISIKQYRGKLLDSPANLLAVMDQMAKLDDLMVKLYAYGEFREAVNTSDRKALESYQQLEADMEAKTSFIAVELKALTPEKLKAMFKKEPALLPYRYIIEDKVRQGPHTLSVDKESILAKFGPDLTAWQPVLFQKVFDRTNFPKIDVNGKKYDVHVDYDTLVRNPDRAVREKAFKEYYGTFEKISDLVGFALFNEMKNYNHEASLRGFDTYYNETLFNRYLSRKQIDNLYSQIEKNLPLYHRYQRYKMDEVRKALGVKHAEIWDMDVSIGKTPQPRYTADQAVDLTKKALSVLGPHYSSRLEELLDPANGRLDIVGGPRRGQGAFTEGYYGFFMDNYQGYLTNVSTIAHEAGHAIHYRIVMDKRKHIIFADGPSYMTESFAMFNELLLRDYILKHTQDTATKKYVDRDMLNEMMYLWELARRAKFEMVSYDRVAEGTIDDEKGFDAACEDTGRLYDLWFPRYPELKVHWIRKHHYWSVPTYYVNYVLAQVLCLTYYQEYLKDPVGFPKRYVSMIENGFDRPASQLLKDFLGIDINDPKLLDGTMDMIKARFNEVKGETDGTRAGKK